MTKLSIVICCANCGDTIEQSCQTARWADELIVVDSGSEDATADIARRYADRYVLELWRGHTGQKQFATGLCRNDWVFFLDGDEECGPELAKELMGLSDQQFEKLDLLLVPRRNYIMGRYVRPWWPDYLTRIFHRHRCTWDDQVLHDTRAPSHPSHVLKLHGWIIHKRHSTRGFQDYFCGQRLDERLVETARQMQKSGRRCSFLDLLFRPMLAFLKFYLLKQGFRDGTFGLLVAQKAAISTQLKYAALWAVAREQKARAEEAVSLE